MKKLALLIALVSTSAFAGNGHIHFQGESTYVNAAYSKTLCFDGVNFRAKIKKCTQTTGRSGQCVAYTTINATQPKYSTRKVCLEEVGRSGTCVKWGRKSYVQQENRTVVIEADRGSDHRTINVSVPSCK